MILDFNQLTCFVAVAEELHFGRAAARLFMTQPPLSRHIQQLEHTLGVTLFERTSRTVRLTTAGSVFLVDARRLLNLAEQAATSARRASKGETGRLTVGFNAVSGLELVPQLVVAAQKALPNIDVVLKEMVSTEQLEALSSSQIDLGFLRPLPARQALESLTVAREPLLVALPHDHPLLMRDSIRPQDLHGIPFVMYTPTGGKYFYGLLSGLFGAAGVMPNYIQHLDLAHSILALVRAGLGVSIVPASAAKLRLDNIVFRPLWRDDIHAETVMAWHPDQRNPALATFRLFAADYFAQKMKASLGTSV